MRHASLLTQRLGRARRQRSQGGGCQRQVQARRLRTQLFRRRGACVTEKATPTKKLEGNAVALQLYASMFGVGLFQHLLTIDDEHTVFSLLYATALEVVDAPILLLGINFVYTRYREYYIHRAIKCLRATFKRENDV